MSYEKLSFWKNVWTYSEGILINVFLKVVEIEETFVEIFKTAMNFFFPSIKNELRRAEK